MPYIVLAQVYNNFFDQFIRAPSTIHLINYELHHP